MSPTAPQRKILVRLANGEHIVRAGSKFKFESDNSLVRPMTIEVMLKIGWVEITAKHFMWAQYDIANNGREAIGLKRIEKENYDVPL